ncbi:MAG: hypothetical protein QF775_00980, partial [archaeon]|nr:hypothetical protein [archaeon]
MYGSCFAKLCEDTTADENGIFRLPYNKKGEIVVLMPGELLPEEIEEREVREREEKKRKEEEERKRKE